MRNNKTVAEKRNYSVLDVKSAKAICLMWLKRAELNQAVNLGLPEIDDRYHIWRVPITSKATESRIGEIVIDARTSLILENKTTTQDVLEARLLGRKSQVQKRVLKSASNGFY